MHAWYWEWPLIGEANPPPPFRTLPRFGENGIDINDAMKSKFADIIVWDKVARDQGIWL